MQKKICVYVALPGHLGLIGSDPIILYVHDALSGWTQKNTLRSKEAENLL